MQKNIFSKFPEISGEKIILLEAILYSLFAVLSKVVLNTLSPIVVMIVTWFFAGILFATILSWKKQWGSLKKYPEQYKNIFFAGLIIGVIFHGLVYYGISLTTAGNAALIGITEILFSYLLFSIWKKEQEKFLHIIGAILMIIGVIIAFWESFIYFSWNEGDVWLLGASAIVPLGNYFQQKVGKSAVPNEMILFVRTVLIMGIFIPLLFIFETVPSFSEISENFLVLFLIGFFILGISKLMWIAGISKISVSKAISISSIYLIFALIFAYFILSEIPSIYQITALFPMGAGIWLLMKK